MNSNSVKKLMRWAVMIVLLCSFYTPIFAGEEEIDVKDLPKAVFNAFQKAYPKAEITSASKEDEDGRIAYEIESVDDEQVRDILYSEEGQVLEVEEEMLFNELPKAVRETIKDEYPDTEVEKAEKITRGGVINYEVVVETEDESLEIVLDAQGKIIKSESADEDEEEFEEENE